MVDYKITKTTLLQEQNNDMCHNFYYLIQGRLYNEDKTKYRKFKFVEWVDIFDAQEYYEKDYVTDKEIKDFALECAISQIEMVNDFNDEKSLKEFYNMMVETIENYNKLACYWNW